MNIIKHSQYGLFFILVILLLQSMVVLGQRNVHKEFRKIIRAPENPDDWPAWRDQLIQARDSIKSAINYSDVFYDKPEFQWAASCYNVNMLMIFDQTFYNRTTNEFLVEEYVEKAISDFGGFDGVVLWHAYPRIGIDDRNQFDFYREMPGGLNGLRDVVERFHRLGVKVFINYNPWDTGTRREDIPDIDALVEILKAINADGIFLDTLKELEDDFRQKLDAVKPGIVLESELELPTSRIFDHHMSWAQWFEDSHVPGVLWNKWIEPRHMLHQIKRWNASHIDEIHTAWMNGSGMLIWENVFGTMVKWNEYEKSIMRAISPILHRYVDLFTHGEWMPLIQTRMEDVYASKWCSDTVCLWTIINRDTIFKTGPVITVSHTEKTRYFNLIEGTEIIPSHSGNEVYLSLKIPPKGIGSIIALEKNAVDPGFSDFLEMQRIIKNISSFDDTKQIVAEKLVPVQRKYIKANQLPVDMVLIDEFPDSLQRRYMMRECGFYRHEGYVPPPHNTHSIIKFIQPVDLNPYAIDITPVTNRQYYDFMHNTGYTPSNVDNFLKHWHDGKPPEGQDDHPVVYVNLDDARAYADWAGKRLPTEDEWQLAAQGIHAYTYPWGNDFDPALCNGGQYGDTSPVNAFQGGISPWGCLDMCGNTWEWTESERDDGYTRYAILKGGSYFQARGSIWYTQGGPQPTDMSVKFIMMYPGLDRCKTIGFRCVVDIKQ